MRRVLFIILFARGIELKRIFTDGGLWDVSFLHFVPLNYISMYWFQFFYFKGGQNEKNLIAIMISVILAKPGYLNVSQLTKFV